MTPYCILFALIGSIALVNGAFCKERRWGLPVMVIVLFFFMAFRARTVGADTNNYVWLFMNHGLSYGDIAQVWASKGDITALYDVYAWLVYQLLPFEQAILVCNSIVICTGVYFFIREYSDEQVLSVLLYVLSFCYFFAFNGMRQSLAGAIVLMALVCVNKKKYGFTVILLVLALGIHQTSLFMVPVCIAVCLLAKVRKYNPAIVMLLCIGAALAVRLLYLPLFGVFAGLFDHFSMYGESGGPFSVADSTQGRQTILYVIIAVFALVASRRPGVSEAISESRCARTLWLVGSLCMGFGIFCTDYELLARLIYYLQPGLACLLGFLATRLDVGEKTALVRMGLLAGYFVLCIYMLQANYSDVVPYRFFWK